MTFYKECFHCKLQLNFKVVRIFFVTEQKVYKSTDVKN